MPDSTELDAANRGGHRIDPILTALGFVPVSLVFWALYGLLISLLGGKNVAYGPGWPQWNYARWVLALDDAAAYYGNARDIRDLYLMAALPCAVEGSLIFMARILYGKTRSIRRFWVPITALTLIGQAVQLRSLFSLQGDSLLWWPTPQTAIPVLTMRFFEIGTVIVWFASPFLVYWITASLMQLWKRRHGGPSGTVFGSTLDSRDGVEV